MMKWPERARRSIAAFFIKWNDFDVFVEDTAKYTSTLYTSFVSRITGGQCKVDKVIPLGDRGKVIDAALADTATGGRRRLYLIDGDLDIISGLPIAATERLFAHRVYHVENYFLCEDAYIQILHEENPRLSIEDIREKLGFSAWLVEVKPLLDLFRVFGLTRILDPSLQTIGLRIGSFSVDHKIDQGKIKAFCIARVSDLRARFSPQQFSAAVKQIDERVAVTHHYIDLISAREFLLPTLKWWIESRGLKMSVHNESLLFRLSKACSLDRHTALVEAIQKCATAKTA